ncbi:MAG: hypothetical protein JJU29_06695 [Verrucomicrobia bacterium]|nr:hypothetical protein [Verrucomicrobiota bacterium]MCH8511562.1 hypothetical protein [Kiritimatiellia bacterium]
MKDSYEILAWLLAGETHPHLKEKQAYLQAEEVLHNSPEIRKRFEEAKAFTERHPELVGFERMPVDVRQRLAEKINEVGSTSNKIIPMSPPNPLSYRKQFAWAAVLALFLAGISMITSLVLDRQPHQTAPRLGREVESHLPEFRTFVSNTAREELHLTHRNQNPLELVQWLAEHNPEVSSPHLPAALNLGQLNGCSVIESPRGKVSLVFVQVDGQPMHLFVACSRALRCKPAKPRHVQLEGRRAIEWVDDSNAYLLLAEDPDVEMPEILL